MTENGECRKTLNSTYNQYKKSLIVSNWHYIKRNHFI